MGAYYLARGGEEGGEGEGGVGEPKELVVVWDGAARRRLLAMPVHGMGAWEHEMRVVGLIDVLFLALSKQQKQGGGGWQSCG